MSYYRKLVSFCCISVLFLFWNATDIQGQVSHGISSITPNRVVPLPGSSNWVKGLNVVSGSLSSLEIFVYNSTQTRDPNIKNNVITAPAPFTGSATAYEIPQNIYCHFASKCKEEKADFLKETTTISQFIEEQAKSSANGFQLDITLSGEHSKDVEGEVPGVGKVKAGNKIKAETKLSNKLLFGRTQLSKAFLSKTGSQTRGCMIASTIAEAFHCEIKNELIGFNDRFLQSLEKLRSNLDIAHVKRFIQMFGTHYYKNFVVGAERKVAIFFTKDATDDVIEQYKGSTMTNIVEVFNFRKEDGENTNKEGKVSHSLNNNVRLSSIQCEGSKCSDEKSQFCDYASTAGKVMPRKLVPVSSLFPFLNKKNLVQVDRNFQKKFDSLVLKIAEQELDTTMPCLARGCSDGSQCHNSTTCITTNQLPGFRVKVYQWTKLPQWEDDLGHLVSSVIDVDQTEFGQYLTTDWNEYYQKLSKFKCEKSFCRSMAKQRIVSHEYCRSNECSDKIKNHIEKGNVVQVPHSAYPCKVEYYRQCKNGHRCSSNTKIQLRSCNFLHGKGAFNILRPQRMSLHFSGFVRVLSEETSGFDITCWGQCRIRIGTIKIEMGSEPEELGFLHNESPALIHSSGVDFETKYFHLPVGDHPIDVYYYNEGTILQKFGIVPADKNSIIYRSKMHQFSSPLEWKKRNTQSRKIVN